MGSMVRSEQAVDVICQHKQDGSIIPIKIRLQDEDGVYQEFVVKAYRVLSHPGQYRLPSEVVTMGYRWTFECKINVLDRERRIKLFYNMSDGQWKAGL